MCLPFYSAPINPPNNRCKTLVSRLRILFYIQIVLAIIKIFFVFSTISSGDSYLDLFGCCALYFAYSQISHIGCVIHIFLSLYSFICEFVVIGTLVQDGVSLFGKSSSNNFYMVMVFISVVFYIVAMTIVFQAYKEFKAVSIEGLLNQPDYGGGYFNQQDDQDYYGQQYNQPEHNQQQQPQNWSQPQQQQPQQPQQQPQPQRNTSAQNQNPQNVQMSNISNNQSAGGSRDNAGNFKAFAGTGYKVGGN